MIVVMRQAEPVSTAASIITLVSACTTTSHHCVSLIKSLHEVPAELLLLTNEVYDISVVLNTANTAEMSPSTNAAIAAQLDTANSLISELRSFITSLKNLKSENGRVVVDRFGWFRKKKIASQLRWRLSKAKENFQITTAWY
jgi:hypothetical protein